MKCPKCSNPLGRSGVLEPFHCTDGMNCDFSISSEKFDGVVNSLYKPRAKYSTPEDNLSALNNFGHKEYSKDYSDEIDRL